MTKTFSKSKSITIKATELNDERTFKVTRNNNSTTNGSDVEAEPLAVALAVNVDGDRQVNVWVDKSDVDSGRVTKEIAQAFADKFMKQNSKEDIYSWITNVFGKEWIDKGQEWNSELEPGVNLINGNGEIDILLTNLNTEYDSTKVKGGYVVGYFWQINTMIANSSSSDYDFIQKNSNGRNMFLVDATFASKPEKRTMLFSTLAHEFVHMINWYQKNLLNGANTKSWLNEMFAMIGEDLVDDKLGDRGSKDRAGDYNTFNYLDINDKDGNFDVSDYAPVALYGAYLTRTYVKNDLSFVRNMMHNSYSAEDAIEYALRKATITGEPETFLDTIKNFGKASVLSNNDSVVRGTKYWMNKPDFQVNEGGVLYSFEPINLFDNKLIGTDNFRFFNVGDTSAPLLNGGANIFYDLGSGNLLTGSRKFKFNLPEGADFEVIVKDASGAYNKEKSLAIQKLIKPVLN